MKLIYPTLLQAANKVKSNSWFRLLEYTNTNYKKKRKIKEFTTTYEKTHTINIDLTKSQKDKINLWLDDCTDIYNLTNSYIKLNLTNDNKKSLINFFNIRKILKNDITNVCKINKLNKHTGDYAVKHCIEMYKSAISNHNDISKFNIRDLSKDRIRKNLVIEPSAVSKKTNSIFTKILGVINSNIPLNFIKRNSILQYNNYKDTYKILVPVKVEDEERVSSHYDKCGIDIGVRTFMTVYSEDKTLEIAPYNNKFLDRKHKRLDNIKSSKDSNIISNQKYKKLYCKYSSRLRNIIDDLHNKSANMLLSRYKNISIGKVSIKQMISNLDSNLKEVVKRRLCTLSHYRFRMKLISMSPKFNCNVKLINEYLTSKTCCKCKNIKNDLKAEKIYNCSKCNLIIDRDINAAINIYLL
jgi:transposase